MSRDVVTTYAKAIAEAEELRRVNAALVEALQGLMVGNCWVKLQGIEAWHIRQIPSDSALTIARNAVALATGARHE